MANRKGPTAVHDIQPKTAKCNAAFEAYTALRKQERDDPALRDNRFFQARIDAAYLRFLTLYGAL